MDWLLRAQARIEKKPAGRHLSEGSLLLYDVTSTYFAGRSCPSSALGHNRGGKKGKLQIMVGLLCAPDGCRVAVEAYPGNTGDPRAWASQIFEVRERWGLQHVVWVADRGVLTGARIDEEIRSIEGLDWITELRSPAIGAFFDSGELQLSLSDERDRIELRTPDYPGERLVAYRNPLLA